MVPQVRLRFHADHDAWSVVRVTVALLYERSSRAPRLPRAVDYAVVVISVLAAAGGLGYVLGLPMPPLFIGGTVILATVALGILGAQIARREA